MPSINCTGALGLGGRGRWATSNEFSKFALMIMMSQIKSSGAVAFTACSRGDDVPMTIIVSAYCFA